MQRARLEQSPIYDRKQIHQVLTDVRHKFETHTVDKGLLVSLYKKYNPTIGDMHFFTQAASDLFPALNCGLASVYIRHILQQGNITNGRYGNENHTFLLVQDEKGKELVTDITADQYDGPDIYLGPLQEPWGLHTST